MDSSQPPWPKVDFDADPRFFIGDRSGPGRRLVARRIDVDKAVFSELRTICEGEWELLKATRPRQYEPFAQLEPREEHFWLPVAEVERSATEAPPDAGEDDSSARLVEIVRSVDRLQPLSAAELKERGYLFYGIAYPVEGEGRVGFIKKSDPRKALGAKKHYFQVGDRLEQVVQPDLVIDDEIDVFITPDVVAALDANAFRNLLNDVQIAFASVTLNVTAVTAGLAKKVPLTASAASALEVAASKRVSLARRLHELPHRVGTINLTPTIARKVCKKFGVPQLMNEEGQFDFDPDGAGVFLDVLEGRYFDDDLGREPRRADRFSRRT